MTIQEARERTEKGGKYGRKGLPWGVVKASGEPKFDYIIADGGGVTVLLTDHKDILIEHALATDWGPLGSQEQAFDERRRLLEELKQLRRDLDIDYDPTKINLIGVVHSLTDILIRLEEGR